MQREVPDLVIEECIPNCEQCPSSWINEQIAHRIVCRCTKCEHHKTEAGEVIGHQPSLPQTSKRS
jgi:hypothetical protein